MAWTQAEIDALRAAIIAIASGSAVRTVTFRDRTVTYHDTDLEQMRLLLAEMEGPVVSATSYRLAAHTKGV